MARYDHPSILHLDQGTAPLPLLGRSVDVLPPRPGNGCGPAKQDQDNDRRNRHPHRRVEREIDRGLRDSELRTLRDIGIFRSLSVEDLTEHRYARNQTKATNDLDSLLRNGLIQRRTDYPERTAYVTLTPRGHRLVAGRHPSGQCFYHGFVKSREARHDAALYRLYQQERRRIEQAGGRLRRVVLDFELKQSINRHLVKIVPLPQPQRDREKQETAARHGLKVVNGKIPLPDLRLEYESPGQEITKVDLELVTRHYHRDSLTAKAKAGFAMYASPQDARKLGPVMADPEITEHIVSL
jgi:DNA-binding MarR family transcriptional regulator